MSEEANADAMFEDAEGTLAIDLSGVDEQGGFEAIPVGTYNMIVAEAEYKLSSKDNPMIELQLQIEDGDYANRKLFTYITFSPKAMAMAKKSIRTLGLAHLLEGPFNPEEAAGDFIGTRCRAKVAIEKYQDEDTNRIKNLLPAVDGGEFAAA